MFDVVSTTSTHGNFKFNRAALYQMREAKQCAEANDF